MIEAVFFVRFLPKKGPVVLHQWPPGSVTRDQRSKRQPLLDVLSLSEYLVPRQDLCNQLISICIDDYRVIGYPMCIIDSDKYARHEFIYNFCVVIKEHIEFSTYERAVSQMAWLLAAAEEQEDFLQRNEEDLNLDSSTELDEKPAVPRLQAFCENFMEDLNRYNECIIPITEAHELNIKLFPTQPPASMVKPSHVPLSVVDLTSMINDDSWDLTMHRVAPHINGVDRVSRIAEHADVDIDLAQQAIRQFLRFGLVVLLDIFQYGATYAPTPAIQRLLFDTQMQEECAEFIALDQSAVGADVVVKLYTGLAHGLSLKSWIRNYRDLLKNVDIRRFVLFGLLKGIIYRVHRFAVKESRELADSQTKIEDNTLESLLDKGARFDGICTELSISPKELQQRLDSRSDVYTIER